MSADALLTPGPPIVRTADAEPPLGGAGDRLRRMLADRSPDAGPVLGSPGRHVDAAELLQTLVAWSEVIRSRVATAGSWSPDADLVRRPVAVRVTADLDSIIAIAAVIDSGHPLVVLDPLAPPQRRELVTRLANAVEISPAELRAAGAGPHSIAPARPAVQPGDAAVIVFTSGSTGRPKAVVHSHAFWLNQITEARLAFDLTPSDRVAQVLPVSYGAGLDVLFMALLNGAALSYYDPRQLGLRGMIEWLTVERATTLHCTPALLRSLLADLPPAASVPGSLRRDSALSQFRLITTCGEQSFGTDVVQLRRHTGQETVFVNWSGSSETGHLAFYRVDPDDQVDDGPLPAGTPAAHKTIRIGPDQTLEVVSDYLFSGYLGDPELTATKIISGEDGRRLFRTGDRARLDHGVLRLLGRSDSAVKIRGYLVEPSEVEAALRSVDAIADAAVVAVTEPAEDDYAPPEIWLAAYVSLDPSRPTISTVGLRAALRERLPAWMQPQAITLLAGLPRTERGKVDRSALPEPTRSVAADLTPPRGATEQQLSALWTRLVGLEAVGREQSFVELGADSLVVEEMLAAAGQDFGVDLLTSDLTENATLAAFARLVEDRARGRAPVSAEGLSLLRAADQRCGSEDPTVFCLAGAGGHGSLFTQLAALLHTTGAVYAIQARGLEGVARPELSMSAMVRRILDLIGRTSPSGPLVLVGHSLGGLLATEVATRLGDQGRRVTLVAVLDTLLPDAAIPPSADPDRPLPTGPERSARELWQLRGQLAALAAGRRYPIGVRKQLYYELGARLVKGYRPVAYAGPSLIVASHENEDLPQWWEPILPGCRAHRRVPCDHLGMLKPPYVQQTADLVNGALTAGLATDGEQTDERRATR